MKYNKYNHLNKEINKLAQEFGLMGEIRESINLGGRWIEATNSEFRSMMESLREIDDSVRGLITGANTDHGSLKDILERVESDINRREYISALGGVVKFYDTVQKAAEELKKLNADFLQAHYQILSQNLDPQVLNDILSLSKRASDNSNLLIKRAGLFDFLHNLFSGRARTLKAWEKRFPKSAAKIKRSVSNLLRISISLNNFIIESLKQMREFRIKRKIEDYLDEKTKLLKRMDNYNNSFKNYYNSEIKEIVDKLRVSLGESEEVDSGESEVVPSNQIATPPAAVSPATVSPAVVAPSPPTAPRQVPAAEVRQEPVQELTSAQLFNLILNTSQQISSIIILCKNSPRDSNSINAAKTFVMSFVSDSLPKINSACQNSGEVINQIVINISNSSTAIIAKLAQSPKSIDTLITPLNNLRSQLNILNNQLGQIAGIRQKIEVQIPPGIMLHENDVEPGVDHAPADQPRARELEGKQSLTGEQPPAGEQLPVGEQLPAGEQLPVGEQLPAEEQPPVGELQESRRQHPTSSSGRLLAPLSGDESTKPSPGSEPKSPPPSPPATQISLDKINSIKSQFYNLLISSEFLKFAEEGKNKAILQDALPISIFKNYIWSFPSDENSKALFLASFEKYLEVCIKFLIFKIEKIKKTPEVLGDVINQFKTLNDQKNKEYANFYENQIKADFNQKIYGTSLEGKIEQIINDYIESFINNCKQYKKIKSDRDKSNFTKKAIDDLNSKTKKYRDDLQLLLDTLLKQDPADGENKIYYTPGEVFNLIYRKFDAAISDLEDSDLEILKNENFGPASDGDYNFSRVFTKYFLRKASVTKDSPEKPYASIGAKINGVLRRQGQIRIGKDLTYAGEIQPIEDQITIEPPKETISPQDIDNKLLMSDFSFGDSDEESSSSATSSATAKPAPAAAKPAAAKPAAAKPAAAKPAAAKPAAAKPVIETAKTPQPAPAPAPGAPQTSSTPAAKASKPSADDLD